jgi:HK97 family phage prohead protease
MPKKKMTTSKPELVFRSFGFTTDERRINEETRTIIMPVSSELPVFRWDGYEVLIHTEESVDLSRMNNGAAVMHSHDWNEQVGVIERAWIEGNRLWAEMRFSRSSQGETVWMDIVDGIRRNVSIGYQVKKKELVKSEDGKEDVYHVTKWMPYEASIVAVPADPSVGVGRSLADTEDSEPETGDNEAETTSKVTTTVHEKKREGIQVM